MFTTDQIKEREQWNADISNVDKNLLDGKLPEAERIIVKLYKVALETKTESGLIEPAYEAFASEDGKRASRFRDVEWQMRGVIVNVHEDKEHTMEVGQTVWLNPRVMNNSSFIFLDREQTVQKPSGYMRIYPANVDLVEPCDKIKLKGV